MPAANTKSGNMLIIWLVAVFAMSGARSAFGLSANAKDAASRRYGGHLVNLVRSPGILAADVALFADLDEGHPSAAVNLRAASLTKELALIFAIISIFDVGSYDSYRLLDTELRTVIFGSRRKRAASDYEAGEEDEDEGDDLFHLASPLFGCSRLVKRHYKCLPP